MTIVCNIGICYFFKCYDNCWFILALLQLATFVSTIAINNCSMPCFNSQLLYTPLLLTSFVCAIVKSKYFMHYYNWRQLLYLLLQLKMLLQKHCNRQLFIRYYDYWLFYVILQLTNLVCAIVFDNFLCTNAIDNFCMLYSNWGILYVVKTTSRSSAIMIIITKIH